MRHKVITKAARAEGHCNQIQQETLTEYLTDLCHRLEDDAGEADSHFDGFHIGELYQQGFVLGCVAQVSVRLCSKTILNHMNYICSINVFILFPSLLCW